MKLNLKKFETEDGLQLRGILTKDDPEVSNTDEQTVDDDEGDILDDTMDICDDCPDGDGELNLDEAYDALLGYSVLNTRKELEDFITENIEHNYEITITDSTGVEVFIITSGMLRYPALLGLDGNNNYWDPDLKEFLNTQ